MTLPAESVLPILTAWAHRPEVRALWLVGSFATGTADRFSDIDARAVFLFRVFRVFRGLFSLRAAFRGTGCPLRPGRRHLVTGTTYTDGRRESA